MIAASKTDTMPIVRRPEGKGHDLVSDDGFRRAGRRGRLGVLIKLRLPSYRSLPLSCISALSVSLDGQATPDEDLILLLENHEHRVYESAERIDIWWFVLDPAEVFVPLAGDIADGEHLVEVGLREIVPYATGGKMALTHSCAKRLRLDADGDR